MKFARIQLSTDLLRMVLDLPPSVKLVHVREGWLEQDKMIELTVTHPDVPEQDKPPWPIITPIYHRVETGKAELKEIEGLKERAT